MYTHYENRDHLYPPCNEDLQFIGFSLPCRRENGTYHILSSSVAWDMTRVQLLSAFLVLVWISIFQVLRAMRCWNGCIYRGKNSIHIPRIKIENKIVLLIGFTKEKIIGSEAVLKSRKEECFNIQISWAEMIQAIYFTFDLQKVIIIGEDTK